MMYAYAAEEAHVVAAQTMVSKIEGVILFPLMKLMLAIAILVFMYGLYEMVLNAGNGEARDLGRKHMLYGMIGFFVMISAYGLLKIAAGTLGVDIPE